MLRVCAVQVRNSSGTGTHVFVHLHVCSRRFNLSEGADLLSELTYSHLAFECAMCPPAAYAFPRDVVSQPLVSNKLLDCSEQPVTDFYPNPKPSRQQSVFRQASLPPFFLQSLHSGVTDAISHAFLRTGFWEVFDLDRPDLVLEAILSTLTSEDVVLDIGANIGTFALRCAGWNFSVHAFEPLLTSANHLEISAHVNGFSNLHVVRKVVSNSSKEHVQICYDLVNFGHAGVPVWGNPFESGACPHGTSAADSISTTLGTCMHVRV